MSEQIEGRVVRSGSHTDLRVGNRHPSLRFRDIGTPLEQIGREAGIERGRFGAQFLARDVKVRCGTSHQDRHGVLKLLSLLLQQNRLGPRGIQQGFFLRDVESRRHASLVPRIDQVQSLLQRVHGALQDSQLGIQLAQIEVVARQLRGDQQAHIFQVRCVCLIRGFRCFDAATALAKQIHLVTHREGQ